MNLGRFILLASATFAAEPPDFARDIRPIFARACSACHGAGQQMGGLRLDSRAMAAKAIHAGDAASSTLYQRVAGTTDQARMPMGGKPLSGAEIETIKRWIDAGAEWPESADVKAAAVSRHWAYVPPQRPKLPAGTAAHPIDRFIRARLVQEGLKPSARAGRATLLRRLALDLTGLPPSPADLDAFLKDSAPNAWRKQIERLLASPHYGERWARHWLDAARYADSDGYEKDKQRQVWFYRDWVINAFNRDVPYDRFVTEQLAGDLLPNATQDQIVATGFLRNSMINEEGGIDPEQFRMEAMFDRMDALGKAVLGVTVQCAQCHNHKYDPISQEEYYRLFAYLNTSYEANVAVYTAAEQQQRAAVFATIAAADAELKERVPDWQARFERWRARLPNAAWTVADLEVDDISTGGQRYLKRDDGSWLAAGYAPTKHRVKLTAQPGAVRITGFRLELLTDPNLPLNGPGRSIKGTGALTEFEAEAGGVKLKFARASADFDAPERELDAIYADKSNKRRVTGPVDFAIDGQDETAWGIDAGPGRRNQPRTAVFVLAAPIELKAGEALSVFLKQNHGGWNSDDNQNHNLGRFRLSYTSSPEPAALPFSTESQAWGAFRKAEFPEYDARVAVAWQQHPEGSTQLVLSEQERARATHLLQRGDFLKPGKAVAPGVPAALNPLPAGAQADRLGLARWLTDRKSPTVARAFVNRVWQAWFGTGLVDTTEDLGKQSPPASHPDLLDWLAVEFMEHGWSVKHLQRLIATSEAYQQSAWVSEDLTRRDPYNRLLARGPRFRVEAEIVRDIALAASGLLNPKVGGPSVYPPAPEFLFQPPVSYGPKVWSDEKGPERYRRALYTFRYRSVPYPVLQSFDAPNGDMACVRRPRSNTPLQALTTLNEPLFYEAAVALGKRAQAEGGATDASQVNYAFRLCTARKPDAAEAAELRAFLQRQREHNPQTAWTALARVLLNLDETITKE